MRTFTNIITINGCFGLNQIRTVVTLRERYASAAMHLSAWHADALGSRLLQLKKLVAARVTRAAAYGQPMCLSMTGPQPCRQPVRRSLVESIGR
jgi:hypothetical protein